MRHTMTVLACAPFLICMTTIAQTQPPQRDNNAPNIPWPLAPFTQLERALAFRGAVIVKGYTEVGTIEGAHGDVVRITAVELSNPSANERVLGLALTVRQAGERSVETVSYIDLDEIDSVLAALDSLARVNDSATAMQHYDAEFRTRGGLEIANIDVGGERLIRVQSFQMQPTAQIVQSSAYFTINRLSELHRQSSAARDLLSKPRAGAK